MTKLIPTNAHSPASTASPAITSSSINNGTNWASLPLESSSPSPSVWRRPSHASRSPSPTPAPATLQRSKKLISVNSDKTFSLLPQSVSASSASDSLKSPRYPSTAPSTFGELSLSDVPGDDRPSSPLTPLAEQLTGRASPISWAPKISSSPPSNYTFVGGLRKVQASSSADRPNSFNAPIWPSPDPVPSLPAETTTEPALGTDPTLNTKQSFVSSQSASTSSENSNFKTYAYSPVPGPGISYNSQSICYSDTFDPDPTERQPNVEILGESSSDHSAVTQQRSQTAEDEPNVLADSDRPPASPNLAESLVTRLRTEYSRESLIVPPLRTGRGNVSERPSLIQSRSIESIRTGSFSSISTAIVEEATRSLFTGTATIHMPSRVSLRNSSHRSFTSGGSNSQWSAFRGHQWSSALSTVISEGEQSSERPSRSLSPLNIKQRDGNGAESHPLSTTPHTSTETNTDSVSAAGQRLDPPSAVYNRQPAREHTSNALLIRDHDEDGDGLADLAALHTPSHVRLYNALSSYSSDRNLRSSSSSRSNSFSRSSIPAWAR